MTATLPGIVEDDGFRLGSITEANWLLASHHYLGPIARYNLVVVAAAAGEVVACAVWNTPTSRHLPADGTWLELSRWCLTSAAGPNAGSRMHGWTARHLRRHRAAVTTLVSYSDPSAGHTGALYKACNWRWAPTWHRLRPPPTANGSWDGITTQAVKDRWVFELRPDERRPDILAINDPGAERRLAALDQPLVIFPAPGRSPR